MAGARKPDLLEELKALAETPRDLSADLMLRAARQALFDVEPAPMHLGRFELRANLGRGGMGVVYEAWDPRLERLVALKVIPASGSGDGRLLSEARALAKLNHPHVVTIYEADVVGDDVLIAMEQVEGRDIRRYLTSRDTALSADALVDLMLGAGAGLAAAHGAGLVHRDIKPENILVASDGGARVTDFGLARQLSPTGDEELARGSGVGGTFRYMAPEQARGEVADARSDQYSFCVSFYELFGCLGSDDFTGVPSYLRRVLQRGLQAQPERRYPDMDALCKAIEVGRHRRRRRKWLVATTSVAALASAALIVFWPTPASAVVACQKAMPDAHQIWNDQRHHAIEAAFLRTKSPLAASAAQIVGQHFDNFRVEFDTAVASACTESKEDVRAKELTRACLRFSAARVDGVARMLGEADVDLVERAAVASIEATDLSSCMDMRAQLAVREEPASPEMRQKIAAVEEALGTTDAYLIAQRYEEGLAFVRELLPLAEETGSTHLVARVQYDIGRLARNAHELQLADSAYGSALQAAEESGDDRLAAMTWVRRLSIARGKGDYELALDHGRQAEAKLRRIGNPPAELAFLRTNQALLATQQAQFELARDQIEETLVLYEPSGTERPRFIGALSQAAQIYARLGDHKKAIIYAKRAVQLSRKAFGPQHPLTAESLAKEANAHSQGNDNKAALAADKEALAIYEGLYGRRSQQVAATLPSLARDYSFLGDLEPSIDLLVEAISIVEEVSGPDDASLQGPLDNLGYVELASGKIADARVHLERALTLSIKYEGKEHPNYARLLGKLALVARAEHRFDDAEALYTEALEILGAKVAATHPALGMMRAELGIVYLDTKQPEKAVAVLELALTSEGRTVHEQAYSRLLLAKARWRTGGKKAGLLEAKAGRALLGEDAVGVNAVMLESIDAWLAKPE